MESTEDTSAPLTPESAAHFFEDNAPGTADKETVSAEPPAEVEPESDDVEAAPEQAETEDESPEAEEPDADADQPDAETFTLTVDGKPTTVTKDELLKGYSRQADYTRKTQELAEQRKAQEAEFAAVTGERAKYAQQLTQLEQAIKSQTPQEPNWTTLRATADPADFAASYAEWAQHKEEMRNLAAEREAAEALVRKDQEASFRATLAEQTRLLHEALPDLKDPVKGKAIRSDLTATAEAIGFTKADLEGVTDHRVMLLLDKARKWDAAQKAKPAIQQQIAKVRTATPGAAGVAKPKPLSAQTAALKRLAQTGSIRDAAASGVFG